MRKITISLFSALLLLSCKSKIKNEILLKENLPLQEFTINPETDTLLRTSHAATLFIQKGTFSGKEVKVQIREAFKSEEILLAGLTTTSDGQPLRSAGMIWFNAIVDGKIEQPLKPVKTKIPAKDPDTSMLVFKGEEEKDGSVNWVNPKQTDTTGKDEDAIERGRLLFKSKCASCHNIFKETAYPYLVNFQYRGPWKNPENFLSWIKNPGKFMASDSYTQQLKRKFGSMMTPFPDFNMRNVYDIVSYLNSVKTNEGPSKILVADTINSRYKDTTALFKDDCGSDTTWYSYKDDFPEYDTSKIPIVVDTIRDNIDNSREKYDTLVYDPFGEGYEFQIDQNGWYNIDAFLKTNPEIKYVKLIADIKTDIDNFWNVYVLIPTEKVLQSTMDKKGNQYYFDWENGTIPLPLNHRAVILAFGSHKNKIYYGCSEFIIRPDQTVEIVIQETTKDRLKNILLSKNIDGIDLQASEKRMEIQKIDCDSQIKKDSNIFLPDRSPK